MWRRPRGTPGVVVRVSLLREGIPEPREGIPESRDGSGGKSPQCVPSVPLPFSAGPSSSAWHRTVSRGLWDIPGEGDSTPSVGSMLGRCTGIKFCLMSRWKFLGSIPAHSSGAIAESPKQRLVPARSPPCTQGHAGLGPSQAVGGIPVHGSSWDWMIFKVPSTPNCSVIPRCIVSISLPVTITKPGLTERFSICAGSTWCRCSQP